MHWSNKYIGIPYSDRNCVQLVADVLECEFGLLKTANDLRGFPEHNDNCSARSKAIKNEHKNYATLTNNPIDGDVIILSSGGRLQHIGILAIVNDKHWCLHATKVGAVLQPIDRILNKYIIIGYYNWNEKINARCEDHT
jgi:hypothetical protein